MTSGYSVSITNQDTWIPFVFFEIKALTSCFSFSNQNSLNNAIKTLTYKNLRTSNQDIYAQKILICPC